jgi:hypothetical protein
MVCGQFIILSVSGEAAEDLIQVNDGRRKTGYHKTGHNIHGGKKMKAFGFTFLVILFMVLAGLFVPADALAHCDGLDGPVVKAARHALETGNVDLVLIWVQKQDEPVIKEAFRQTLAVRKLGPEARNLADMYFFETLVRIHRAGEGAPYTGLKPAGRDLGPAIPAADEAIVKGTADSLAQMLTASIRGGLMEQFKGVMERRSFDTPDIDKGREYVRAYVEFIHYVERLYEAAQKPASGHAPESAETHIHD